MMQKEQVAPNLPTIDKVVWKSNFTVQKQMSICQLSICYTCSDYSIFPFRHKSGHKTGSGLQNAVQSKPPYKFYYCQVSDTLDFQNLQKTLIRNWKEKWSPDVRRKINFDLRRTKFLKEFYSLKRHLRHFQTPYVETLKRIEFTCL